MKIVLGCALGMSTSLLVKKMQEKAPENYEISAVAVDALQEAAKDADVILLGPQVSFRKNSIAELMAPIAVEVIPMVDYGTMNADNVIKLAESLAQK